MKQIEAIYIAGKMGNDDWRYDFFDKYEAPEGHDFQLGWHPFTIEHGTTWPARSPVTVCGLMYTGPFFVDVLGGHGYSAMDGEVHGGNIQKATRYHQERLLEEKRKQVQQWCFNAIQQADLVFAWIDRVDCYGTIAEIGYAKAVGKEIWIAGPQRYDDMWFVYRMADQTTFTNKRGNAAPAAVFRDLLREYRRMHGWFDSPIEQAFWHAWIATKRPFEEDLVSQYSVGKYFVDFAHVASKTAIELDGHATHSTPDAIASDRKRQRAIEDMGWHVIRFGGKEVFVNAPACVAEARKVLEKRIAQMKALPSASHPRFASGDKVRHPLFGDGVVIKGEDVEGLIDVQFKIGRKHLNLTFAKLEKLPL